MAGPVAFETGHSGLGFLGKTQVVGGFWAPARANTPLPLSRRNFALYRHCFCTAFIAEHGILSALFELHRLLIERGFRRSSRDDRQFRPAIGAPAPPDEEDERVSCGACAAAFACCGNPG